MRVHPAALNASKKQSTTTRSRVVAAVAGVCGVVGVFALRASGVASFAAEGDALTFDKVLSAQVQTRPDRAHGSSASSRATYTLASSRQIEARGAHLPRAGNARGRLGASAAKAEARPRARGRASARRAPRAPPRRSFDTSPTPGTRRDEPPSFFLQHPNGSRDWFAYDFRSRCFVFLYAFVFPDPSPEIKTPDLQPLSMLLVLPHATPRSAHG